jgi:hypothetical protein
MMLKYAKLDRFGEHTLSSDPVEADLILFAESSHYNDDPSLSTVRRHEFVGKFRNKAFIYNEQDIPHDALPGLYVSMPRRWFNHSRQRSFPYLTVINPFVSRIGVTEVSPAPDFLFSFVGQAESKLRKSLFRLHGGDCLLEDTTHIDIFNKSDETIQAAKLRYADILFRSKFVLCPRGGGSSSFRLYETMEAGRVPVVISDQWVEPQGPDWQQAVIRVPERSVESIPNLLREYEADWEIRAKAARIAWLEYFSPQVLFHRAVESLMEIAVGPRIPEWIARRVPSGIRAELLVRSVLRQTRGALQRALAS